ncbi:hypothetical protein [Solidesulfovibrio alcoholivorans]|uniref:hypothetical protein n=1 Tax=Solidesulfovibrio alcoholivorans TaxID=81406 RepID=UPI00049704B6|nr:hypothetical protein [Solidesulfovibrio alcoholivorans]
MATSKRTYNIQPITGDNRRPGDPKEGFFVYYRPHESFGWLGRKPCPSLADAEAFAASLDPSGERTDLGNEKAPTGGNR